MKYSYDVFEWGGRAADCSLNKRAAMLSTELWKSKNNLVLFPFKKKSHNTTVKGHFHKQRDKNRPILTNFVGLRNLNLKREVYPDLPQCWIWWNVWCSVMFQWGLCQCGMTKIALTCAFSWHDGHYTSQRERKRRPPPRQLSSRGRCAVVPHMLGGCCQPACRSLPRGRGLRSKPASTASA